MTQAPTIAPQRSRSRDLVGRFRLRDATSRNFAPPDPDPSTRNAPQAAPREVADFARKPLGGVDFDHVRRSRDVDLRPGCYHDEIASADDACFARRPNREVP